LISLVVAFSLAGSVMGLLTGLIPGIHVNTLASLLLVGYPAIAGALQELIPGSWIPVGVCCLIMSASVVHSFVDFVPSVFIGAPDADTALSVLPGHRLLLRGEGMKAVRAAAVGSLVGCTSALLLALPLQYIMSYGVSDAMDRITKIVLLIVSGVLLMNEYRKGNLLYGTAAFVLSGALGYAVMKMPIPASGILGEGTLLMPMLTGLFGLPTMIMASKGHPFPAQKECRGDPVGPIPGLKGVIMGTVAGWFPGITSTVGATVSATIMPDRSPERFISTVASIGTVTSVLSLVTLSVSGGGRSGTVIVIGQILGDSIRGTATEPFILLLLAAAVGSLLGYFLTIRSAEVMCGLVSRVPQNLMNRAVIAFLVLMVVATTGLWGIVILASALAIGLIPVSAENGKTVLCGCLILPVLLM
jgi:putative membrane protein